MPRRWPSSGEFIEEARRAKESGAPPVPAHDAATVMLLREGGRGVEVYLLRRVVSMAFAAGMYVFPGGRVDARDGDTEIGWIGPPRTEWAAALGVPPDTAAALVCAACRETFEESGVLLAGESAHDVVADTTGDDWEADRAALVDRSLAFAALLYRRGLVLRTDLLRAWSRWVTPRLEPRRFDTRFFVAALPEGQRTRDVGGEADRVAWLRPADALDGKKRGEIRLMVPTESTLMELADYGSVADVLAAAEQRTIAPVQPELEFTDDGAVIVVPDAADGSAGA